MNDKFKLEKTSIKNNNINNIKEARENKLLNAVVYLIVAATVIMTAPLIYKFADEYAGSRTALSGDGETVNDRTPGNRRFTVEENIINISGLRNTEFGELSVAAAKITDNMDIILFCSGRAERTEGTERSELEEPEEVMRIALINTDGQTGEINISVANRAVRDDFIESFRNKDYTFKDYGDGTFFLSNNKSAFLFDTGRMRITDNYSYPGNFNIYQTSLSNNKETLALATDRGFFVANPRESNMTINASNMKEIIAAAESGGASLTARTPVWSGDDRRIFYRLYADNFVRNAGITAASPGENEQLTSLEANNFIFLNDNIIFYYFLPGTDIASAGQGNLFRGGYFNIGERRMREVMRSQVNYFQIDVSSNGEYLAALSPNGIMTKLSVIDIQTKKLIYSSLYNIVYDFSFSPDEKNLVVYGRTNSGRTLRVINIDRTEE
ncbi:MAG: hypothetical protein FWH10_00890 [Oscillospiraceae bacterium]|nr:hypothetical protein [Oscillospiraceae bacterium]